MGFFFPPLSELTLFSLETSNNCTGPKDEVKIILKQFAIKTSNCISLLAIQFKPARRGFAELHLCLTK